jgi:hypothetical protein
MMEWQKIDFEMKSIPAGRVKDVLVNHTYRAAFFCDGRCSIDDIHLDIDGQIYFTFSQINAPPSHFMLMTWPSDLDNPDLKIRINRLAHRF